MIRIGTQGTVFDEVHALQWLTVSNSIGEDIIIGRCKEVASIEQATADFCSEQ